MQLNCMTFLTLQVPNTTEVGTKIDLTHGIKMTKENSLYEELSAERKKLQDEGKLPEWFAARMVAPESGMFSAP